MSHFLLASAECRTSSACSSRCNFYLATSIIAVFIKVLRTRLPWLSKPISQAPESFTLWTHLGLAANKGPECPVFKRNQAGARVFSKDAEERRASHGFIVLFKYFYSQWPPKNWFRNKPKCITAQLCRPILAKLALRLHGEDYSFVSTWKCKTA